MGTSALAPSGRPATDLLLFVLSRRYALQLLTPASILSKVQGRTEIALEDVAETDGLFLDAKSSARMLHERGEGQYLR